MVNIRKKRYAYLALVLAVLFLSVWMFNRSDGSGSGGRVRAMADFVAVTDESLGNGYDRYLAGHAGAERPDEVIRIEGEDFVETVGDGFAVVDRYEGLDGTAVLTPETGSISWDVPVSRPGLYNIRIHYYPVQGKSSAVERSFSINGEIPFKGAELLLFDRTWGNRHDTIRRDDRGNDLRPTQVEKPAWRIASFTDSEGDVDEPYAFHFDRGVQRITLTALREPMAIDYIELYQEPEIKSYEEVRKGYEADGLKPASNQLVILQAEDAVLKSSPTLYPLADRSSSSVEPYHVSKIRINTIGGLNWKLPGQWIEWEFEVEEDGLYHIALKRKQDQLRGLFATRSIMIDGQYPFREMKRVRFDFDMKWRTDVLGGEEPYFFYLTKGKHRIRMQVTLGEIAPLIRTIESSVLQLNELYRKIVMITSNTPDPYRDYQLEKRIPDMLDVLGKQADTIRSVADYLEQTTGERSDKVAVLHTMVHQLEEMAAHPETVARRLNSFKINVGALGTWLLTVREQPLTLDYLVIYSPDRKPPRAEATLLERIKHELGSLVASYTEDYDSIGNIGGGDRSITVWITTGRDQAQVLKGLIDDYFTPETNIAVKLRLVPAGILLPATLAGEGPDVAL